MITTKTGIPVAIKGDMKSLKGKRPFSVRHVNTFDDNNYLNFLGYLAATGKARSTYWDRPSKLKKNELKYDSEDELYEACGYKKN